MINFKVKISIVFIDVDRTLLKCESFRIFLLKRYFGSYFLRIWHLIYPYSLRRLGIYEISKFKQESLSIFRGLDRSTLESIGYEFSQNILLKNIRNGALQCLNKYKEMEIPVYLISASPSFYVKALSDLLTLSGYFATELKYDNNDKYTGKFLNGDFLGRKRALAIRKFCEKKGISLDNVSCYSDNNEDLPLLASVGFPIAVWPDDNLIKECRKRGWPVEYW